MLTPFIQYFRKKAEAHDPKAYKIMFVPSKTIIGMKNREGWSSPHWLVA